MNREDADKLAKAIDRAVSPTIKLSDTVSIQPNVPGSVDEWSRPLDALGREVKILIKPSKNTTIALSQKGDRTQLTLTKKF